MSAYWKKLDKRRWAIVRRQVFERDGWRCRQCDRPSRLECDHVRPVADGGAVYDLDNLQAICRRCHIEKSARENRAAAEKAYPRQAAWRKAVDELLTE